MKRQYLYLYRTRRPSGWGQHIGYVGVTNSPLHRDVQHRAYQPWSDLIACRYVIPLGRVPRFVALGLEALLIRLTLPVYNVQHNRGNLRRIKPWTARAQRDARYYGRTPVAARFRDVLAALPVVALVIAAVVLWSR